MEVVGKFKLGKNIYVIVSKNNKYRVGRLEDNLVNYNLTDEEKKVIMIVVDRLLPKNNGIKISSLKINNTVYDISVSNNIYMFNPKPNQVDLKVLNGIFNSQSECLYYEMKNNDGNFIKRFIKLGKRTLLVLLSSTMLLSTSSSLKSDIQEQFEDKVTKIENTIIDDDKIVTIIDEPEVELEGSEIVEEDDLPTEVVSEIQNNFDNQIVKEDNFSNNSELVQNVEDINENEVESEEHFDFNDITQAVNSNPNIGEKEKETILSNKFIFEDNFGYYDYDNLLSKLSTLNIIYNTEKNSGIAGTYTPSTNVINFYDVTSFEDTNLIVFTHEFSHLIQGTNPRNSNSFFTEGTNALANKEYYQCEEYSYPFQRMVIHILNLIVGDDLFKNYYTTNDVNMITSELYKIYPDEEKANEFIELTNYYQRLYYSSLEGIDLKDAINETEQMILQELSFYYETKYQRSVESDLLMLYFVNKGLFIEEISNMYEIEVGDSLCISLEDAPNIINRTDKNVDYTINFVEEKIIDYIEESYDDCLTGGLISETGEPVINGLIIDKENNKVLRPRYDRKERLIEINNENRFINDDLNR